jgi:GNAT superfamily N-acetyltransferase
MGWENMEDNLGNGFMVKPSSEALQEEVHRRLREYNRPFFRDQEDFSFHVERDGQIVAGIVAGSTYQTLEVEFLFVDEAYRGRGLGSLLLRTAEERARDAGIRHVLLNTYSFQAPGFYPKEGYTELFRIDNCLGPHSQHFFWKDLKEPGDPAGSQDKQA